MSEDQDNLDAKNGKCDSDESEILDINDGVGGGGHICDQEHPYTDKVEKDWGSVLLTVGETVSQGRGRKDISGNQSCVLSGRGVLHEQM